ncbi:carbohydrate ABC transporter permease [Vallitalea okinawensis]|uniref:carbohydrate ABC transporter permease n=1 Tax=Vallitalea okinawensis TaxID=2078660 RepID=UPI000CFCCFCB|nr:sugar ABC transporter permease [Vallitalea okinawensis]
MLKTGHLKISTQQKVFGLLFAAPWILGFIIFTLFPITEAIRFSFMDYNILEEPNWIGIDNYRHMFTKDPLFYKSLYNTAYYVIFQVPLSIFVGLGIALMLNKDIKGIAAYRTLFYMPSIVPIVAGTILWKWMFHQQYGILTNFVEFFGIAAPGWLSDPGFAKNSIIIMSLWGAGGGMIIYLAGLKNIPRMYYESAELDGASSIKKFLYITLPLLTPTIFFQLIMGIIGSFQIFTQAYVMTGGGPNDSTLFYYLHLFYSAFKHWKMGYACALAWVLFIIIMFFTVINFTLSKKWVHYS